VPGLAAKPIIDIQISVERLHPMDLYAAGLAHHVHIVEAGGEEERRTLAFRDHLRAHVEVAREYEALKEKLAGQFDGESLSSREAYADAKSEFIAGVLRRTLA
jgi:GrpB-like predicted nucleotidyltransferase (UPF0157 family)